VLHQYSHAGRICIRRPSLGRYWHSIRRRTTGHAATFGDLPHAVSSHLINSTAKKRCVGGVWRARIINPVRVVAARWAWRQHDGPTELAARGTQQAISLDVSIKRDVVDDDCASGRVVVCCNSRHILTSADSVFNKALKWLFDHPYS